MLLLPLINSTWHFGVGLRCPHSVKDAPLRPWPSLPGSCSESQTAESDTRPLLPCLWKNHQCYLPGSTTDLLMSSIVAPYASSSINSIMVTWVLNKNAAVEIQLQILLDQNMHFNKIPGGICKYFQRGWSISKRFYGSPYLIPFLPHQTSSSGPGNTKPLMATLQRACWEDWTAQARTATDTGPPWDSQSVPANPKPLLLPQEKNYPLI